VNADEFRRARLGFYARHPFLMLAIIIGVIYLVVRGVFW
jgi:hypothetical protein